MQECFHMLHLYMYFLYFYFQQLVEFYNSTILIVLVLPQYQLSDVTSGMVLGFMSI